MVGSLELYLRSKIHKRAYRPVPFIVGCKIRCKVHTISIKNANGLMLLIHNNYELMI